MICVETKGRKLKLLKNEVKLNTVAFIMIKQAQGACQGKVKVKNFRNIY